MFVPQIQPNRKELNPAKWHWTWPQDGCLIKNYIHHHEHVWNFYYIMTLVEDSEEQFTQKPRDHWALQKHQILCVQKHFQFWTNRCFIKKLFLGDKKCSRMSMLIMVKWSYSWWVCLESWIRYCVYDYPGAKSIMSHFPNFSPQNSVFQRQSVLWKPTINK